MLAEKTTRKVWDNNGKEWDVYSWYLTKNGWEYWQLEPADSDGFAMCYVQGMAHEFGSVRMPDLEGHLMARAAGFELWGLSPPLDSDMIGWSWSENEGEEI